MPKIVGVRFKQAGRIYYYNQGILDLQRGDEVIAETERGLEYGQVVTEGREATEEDATLSVVQRKVSDNDRRKLAENKRLEKEAFAVCEEKIAAHRLPMKLIKVEFTFDISKIIFFFTADGRIDFRELVKDLAAVFRTRIELRQVGVRDEARHLGGIGYCGRPLCCATFLGDFEPVSIRMAKGQNLSLNPTKISGICGRLMCCLKFESDSYDEEDCPRKTVSEPPTVGKRVICAEGTGRVISVNAQRRNATILLDDGETVVTAWDDVAESEEEIIPEKVVRPPRRREVRREDKHEERRNERRDRRRDPREGRKNPNLDLRGGLGRMRSGRSRAERRNAFKNKDRK